MTFATEGVARDALDAVADHGAAVDLARYGQAEPRGRGGQPVQAEIAPVRALALGEATFEIGRKADPLGAPVVGVVWRVHTDDRRGGRRGRVARLDYGVRR